MAHAASQKAIRSLSWVLDSPAYIASTLSSQKLNSYPTPPHPQLPNMTLYPYPKDMNIKKQGVVRF